MPGTWTESWGSVYSTAQPADCRHVGNEPAEGRFLPAPLCVWWQGRGSQQVFILVLTCKCYMCSSLGFFSFTSSLTKTNLKRSYFSPSIQRNTHILLLITVLTVILEDSHRRAPAGETYKSETSCLICFVFDLQADFSETKGLLLHKNREYLSNWADNKL